MSFPGALDGAFLAALQSLDGSDPATLRLTSLGIGTASFFLEEEQSQDAEVNHTTEVVGWIALDGTGLIA